MTTIGEQQFMAITGNSLNRIANSLEELVKLAKKWDEYFEEAEEEE